MLNNLRAASETWKGRLFSALLMGLIVVSFAFFGVRNFISALTSTTVATVGSTKIDDTALRDAFAKQLQAMSAKAKHSVTTTEAVSQGVDKQVMAVLVDQAAMDGEAKRLGLAVSDAEVATTVTNAPQFAGAGGKFDPNLFQNFLQNNGMNEDTFALKQRQALLHGQILSALTSNFGTPVSWLDVINRAVNETRSIDYILLPKAAAGTIRAPDDKQLAAYFAPRASAWAAPEYRKLVMLDLEPGQLQKTIVIPDAQAKPRYEVDKARLYTKPEQRQVQQITFKTEAGATAAAAKIAAGTSFTDIAAARKLSPADYDLGLVKQGTLLPAIDKAAFSLAEGATSAPIKNLIGYALVHVAKIVPKSIVPYAEVAPAIKAVLAKEAAGKELQTLHDKIEDARSNGKDLADAAAAVGLKARTVDAIDAAGKDPAGKPVAGLEPGSALLRAVFDTAVGVDNETITTKGGGIEWFELKSVDPAHQRSLAQVRPLVLTSWQNDQIDKALSAKAMALVAQLNKGATLADLAKANGNLPVLHVADVKREGTPDLGASIAAQVFNVHVGQASSAPEPGKGWAVFKVLDALVPPFTDAKLKASVTRQLQAAIGNDVAREYVDALKAQQGVKIDAEVVAKTIGANVPAQQ